MARPKASRQAQSQAGSQSDASHSIDASQEAAMKNVRELMNEKQRKTKERRRQHRDELDSAYQARLKKLHDDIDHCVEKHHSHIRSIRRPQVQKLIDLERTKREIQSRIERCQAELEQAFVTTSKQLQVAVNGRIEELAV